MKKPISDTEWARRAVSELLAQCVKQSVEKWRTCADEMRLHADALARRVK